MEDFSFYQFNKIRKDILRNSIRDFATYKTDSNVLISAPHAVSQVRLGKLKVAEIGSLSVAKIIADNTGANLIVKTKNNNDDANFDTKNKYRDEIKKIIKDKKIKYIFDIHGLSKNRDCDINLGVNFGQNIKNDISFYDKLVKVLTKNGFKVCIDQPFAAGNKTISGYFAKKYNVWTIQMEINCKITNEPENIDNCNKLLNILINNISKL